jgi:hypothetical protein
MRKITFSICVFCLLMLSACSPANTGTEKSGSPTQENAPFLVYTRSGGFAGVNEKWSLYTDGRIVPEKGEARQATPQAAQALLDQFLKADLSKLSTNNQKPDVCADCFTVELTLNSGGKRFSLSVVPESAEADPTATALANAVQQYIDSAH